MITTRMLTHAVAALLLCCMSGCGVLPTRENIQLIEPQVKVAPDAAWPNVTWQLSIARPSADRMLDSNRIAVSPTTGDLQVYKGAAWSDPVPDVLQTAVVEAFEDSGKIPAVARQATAMRADYLLLLDIRDFEAVYADPKSPPNALIEVAAKLIDANGHVVAARTFRQSAAATATAVPAVAGAFDNALSALTRELVGWSLNAGQQAQATSAKPVK